MSSRRFDWSNLRSPLNNESPTVHTPSAREAVGGSDVSTTDDQRAATSSSAQPATDDRRPATPLALRVNDLKQYAYCPRIVFYQYAMPVQRKATFKMEHGKIVEQKVEQLERRRKLREYGLERGERRFQVWLSSASLGLSGRLDLMITTARGVFPVDFKDTRERVHRNHHVQLCAYALLVEETFDVPVSTGFIYRVPRHDVAVVDITPELRVETRTALREIREMIRNERMPPPTPVRARCTDCEYLNYCGDVF
jgi:CRISPR-associated exonuclease Cas4